MFCGNCGANIPDNAAFCPNCGTKTAARENGQQSTAAIPVKPKKKKKKLLLFGGLAVVLIAAVVAVLFLFKPKPEEEAAKSPKILGFNAKMDENGTAYIPLMNGEWVELDDEVEYASITADRRSIVVLCEDGRLYVTDPELEEEHEIADDAVGFGSGMNDGFAYYDEAGDTYRVSFKDYEPVLLEDFSDAVAAPNSITTLLVTNGGEIGILTADSEEVEKIGTHDGDIRVHAVSDNGQIAVWSEYEDSEWNIVIHDDGEALTLGQVEDYYETYVTFSADQKLVVVVNRTAECMWIKEAGEDPVEVELGFVPFSTPFTSELRLSDVDAGEVSSLYIGSSNDAYGFDMYNITLDGDCEKVLSQVKDYWIMGGKVLYITEDGDLFWAELDGDELGEETRIDRDVDGFLGVVGGEYTYYTKYCEDGTCTLCGYSAAEDEARKISSDAACSGNYAYGNLSTDGKTILFYEDVQYIDGSGYSYGNLMMWDWGDESATRIARNVIVDSATSYRQEDYINKDSFVFAKFNSVNYDSSNELYADWMYFDGEEADSFAEDVIY